MVTQLEGTFGVSLVADHQVCVFLVECSHVIIIVASQTLKTVAAEGGQLTDGTIEDDDGEENTQKSSSTSDLIRRWLRISRCAVNISARLDLDGWHSRLEGRGQTH